MICPKCGYTVTDDSVFCGKCGASIKSDDIAGGANYADDENLEKTMTIPVIKPGAYKTAGGNPVPRAVSHSAPVRKPSAEAPARRPNPPPAQSRRRDSVPSQRNNTSVQKRPAERKQETASDTKGRSILIFAVVFLLAVLIGLGAMYVFIAKSSADRSTTAAQTDVGETAGTTDNFQSTAVQEPEEASEEAEEETEKDSGSSSGAVADYVPEIELSYSFDSMVQSEETEGNKELGYMSYDRENFDLQYKVPSLFRSISTGSREVRYVSGDNTAYIDVGTMTNDEGWSLRDVVDSTIEKLGGVTGHKITGNDTFAVTTDINGVQYYQKCVVTDKYIRYVEVVFPSAYSDTYSPMVSEVESGFVCR